MLLIRNSIIILFFVALSTLAYQTAEDYFHGAAQTYILSGDVKKAKGLITEGLEKYPGDPALIRLAAKIKEVEKQQQQQNDQKQNDKQQKQDQKQQEQNQKRKNDKQDQEQQQNQQKEEDKKEQQQDAQEQKSDEDMKKEEARRIIELYADDADSLNKPTKKAVGKQRQPEKDW